MTDDALWGYMISRQFINNAYWWWLDHCNDQYHNYNIDVIQQHIDT